MRLVLPRNISASNRRPPQPDSCAQLHSIFRATGNPRHTHRRRSKSFETQQSTFIVMARRRSLLIQLTAAHDQLIQPLSGEQIWFSYPPCYPAANFKFNTDVRRVALYTAAHCARKRPGTMSIVQPHGRSILSFIHTAPRCERSSHVRSCVRHVPLRLVRSYRARPTDDQINRIQH